MTEKAKQLYDGQKKLLTYGQVMSRLNDIAKNIGADFASYENNLKDFDGNGVSGFKFSNHETAIKLGRLLTELGIRYSNAYDDIKSQAGRLEIDKADRKIADDLFAGWASSVVVEQKVTANAEQNAKWNMPVGKTR